MRWCVLFATACRLNFDERIGEDAAADGKPLQIAYAGPFAQRHPGVGTTDSFATQASRAGDAILLQVSCSDGMLSTGVTVTAAGWSFAELAPITKSTGSVQSALFVARAPDTAMTTVTVTWAVGCTGGKGELGDEFTNADPAAPFDAHVQTTGTGDCTGSITTGRANDAVWAACFSATTLTAPGPGFTKAADDAGGDWAEYELTSDPPGTTVPVTYFNSNVDYVLSIVALAPAL